MWNSWDRSAIGSVPYASRPLCASARVAGPAEGELVSLSAMKEILRDPATQTTNNARISSWIVSARRHAERYTRRSLVKKRYLMCLSRFPNYYLDRTDKLNLWYPPLAGDVSIKYIDNDGAEQTLAGGDDFQVDPVNEPGRVAPLAQKFWPVTKWGALNAVRILYTAGYESNSSLRLPQDAEANDISEPETLYDHELDLTIPEDLVDAVTKTVVYWYNNRSAVNAIPGAGGNYVILPMHVQEILDSYVFDTLTPTVTPEF